MTTESEASGDEEEEEGEEKQVGEDEEEAALAAELRGGATSLTNRSSRCSGMSHRSNTAAGVSHRQLVEEVVVMRLRPRQQLLQGWKWRRQPDEDGSACRVGWCLCSILRSSFITRGGKQALHARKQQSIARTHARHTTKSSARTHAQRGHAYTTTTLPPPFSLQYGRGRARRMPCRRHQRAGRRPNSYVRRSLQGRICERAS